MESLYEYVEHIYDDIAIGLIPLSATARKLVQRTAFGEMLSNDDKCLALIQAELEFKSVVSRENRHRASHILVTWLLGIGLGRYFELDILDEPFGTQNYSKLWLQTSIIHDYGYLSEYVSQNNLSLHDVTKNGYLLTDTYYESQLYCINNMSSSPQFGRYFTYSYDELEKYFEYSKYYHKKDAVLPGAELVDHGILGGCLAFDKYCEEISKPRKKDITDEITTIQKLACYIAASHNVFKSSDLTDDKYKIFGLYNILSTSSVRIDETNKILLLLSLVDTIECTKRFSKKSNPKQYLEQGTTIKKVGIILEEGTLKMDYSNLYNYVDRIRQNNDMRESVINHIKGIRGLSSWTSFVVSEEPSVENYKVTISLK